MAGRQTRTRTDGGRQTQGGQRQGNQQQAGQGQAGQQYQGQQPQQGQGGGQYQGQQGAGGGGPGGYGYAGGAGYGGGSVVTEYAKLATALYLTLGIGTAITLFLFGSMAGGGTGGMGGGFMGGLGFGGTLAGVFLGGMVLLVVFGAIVASGLGVFIGRDVDAHESAPVASGAGNAIGSVVALFVLAILGIVFAPGPMGGGFGQLIAGIIGAVIGIGATGAVAGFIGQNLIAG